MQPHETIELIIKLVCNHYDADWRKFKCSRQSKIWSRQCDAKIATIHLITTYLGDGYAADLFNCSHSVLGHYRKWHAANRKEIGYVSNMVYSMIKHKSAE